MEYRIEKNNKRYDRIYFACEKCGKDSNVLLRIELQELQDFDFICKKCRMAATCLEEYGPGKATIKEKKRERKLV